MSFLRALGAWAIALVFLAAAVPALGQQQTPAPEMRLIPLATSSPAAGAPVIARPARFAAPSDGFSVRYLEYFYTQYGSAMTARGIAGIYGGNLVTVDPSIGRVYLIRKGACDLVGVTGDAAVVNTDCSSGLGTKSQVVSIADGRLLWKTAADEAMLLAAHGLTLSSTYLTGFLLARDAQSGRLLRKAKIACNPGIPLAMLNDLAVFSYNPSCGSSADSGFLVLDVRTGRVVDDSANVPNSPGIFGESENLVFVESGGGRDEYAPTRVFLYDGNSARTVSSFVAAPDPPPADQSSLGDYHADHVTLGSGVLYVGIEGDTYRYPIGSSPVPARIDPSPGTWLGTARGNRLYFADGRTLWAADVGDERATAIPVTGTEGPYSSMIVHGDRGYVLTRDRRIVTIDLIKNAAIRATLAPRCYALLKLETVHGNDTALCSLDDPVTHVIAIGL